MSILGWIAIGYLAINALLVCLVVVPMITERMWKRRE